MNIFDALNSLIKAKTILPDPTQAVAQQVGQAAQNGNWNLGQFGNNAANGVGKLAGAVVGLPGAVFKAVTQPDTVPETVTNAVKQTGMDINNAFGQPVNPQNGHIQMPNAGEAAQNFYNDPVNAALNYSIVGGAARDLGVNFAKSAAETAAKTATEDTAKAATLPGGAAADVPRTAVQSFKQRYTVPTKRAGAGDLNTVGTSQEILAHVKSGGDLGLHNVNDAPDFVTGANGIISKMTRAAVGGVDSTVPLAEAAKTAQDYLNTQKVLVPEEKAAQIVSDIGKADPGKGSFTSMNAQDAMDYARQLEAKAAQFNRASTYLTPRPEMEAIGKAYSQAADNIMEQIDKASEGTNIDAVKTPENMAALQQFSPRLAQQVQNAQNVSQLRSTAAPFVRLSKMQDIHEATTGSTMNKAAGKMGAFVKPATTAGAVIGSTLGPLGTAAGAGAGAILDEAMEPVYNAGINKVREPLGNAVTNHMLNHDGSSVFNPFSGTGFKVAGGTGAAVVGNSTQDVGQNGQNVNSDNQHGQTISQFDPNVNTIDKVPQQASDLKPNPDGTIGIANIYTMKDTNGNQLFMSPEAIKNQQLQLDKAKGTTQYKYNPKEQLRVDSLQNQLDTVKNFSDSMGTIYPKALTVNKAYSQAIQDMSSAPKNILNYNGKFDDFVKQVSQSNANLATQLKAIELAGGIDPNTVIKGSTLLGALQTAQKADLMSFYNALSSTGGYTGGAATPPAAVVNTAQAAAPQNTGPIFSPSNQAQPPSGGIFTPSFSSGQPAIASQ